MTEREVRAELDELLGRVPEGWTRQIVGGRAWGLSRVEHVDGQSTTVTAEQLGGAVHFSANIWHTSDGPILRPCEVPAEMVLDFLHGLPKPAPNQGLSGDPDRVAR